MWNPTAAMELDVYTFEVPRRVEIIEKIEVTTDGGGEYQYLVFNGIQRCHWRWKCSGDGCW
jgi:hypothetical protein